MRRLAPRAQLGRIARAQAVLRQHPVRPENTAPAQVFLQSAVSARQARTLQAMLLLLLARPVPLESIVQQHPSHFQPEIVLSRHSRREVLTQSPALLALQAVQETQLG